jgi:1-acyl-sn-glycerol-3-phosphate acyltransferase
MNIFRFFVKTGLFLFITMLLAPFYFLILLIFFRWRLSIGPRLVRFYSGLCLIIFRVNIEKIGDYEVFHKIKGRILIISNHSSFLDIFVLSALFGSVFVSKAEIKYYPVIGQIAWLVGVIFLRRNSSSERLRVINTIAANCPNRIIAVFPQGTTSRTVDRLSFNRGVFKVIDLNPEILLLPVTLCYKDDADIAWNRPQSLMENAMRVCAKKRIDIKVFIHEPFTTEHYQENTAAQICIMVEDIVFDPLKRVSENYYA